MRIACLVAVWLLLGAGSALAGSREVQYAPSPAWVVAAPQPTNTAPPSGAAVQIVYSDFQTHVDADAATYAAWRLKILKPDGLAAGNISMTWDPSSDTLTVHRLKIHRGDQVIDVLAKTKFQVIQREKNLDSAMLDGALTATLQTPGLQVGDELEFAETIRHHDLIFGGRTAGFFLMAPASAPGAHRTRLEWAIRKRCAGK